MPRGDGTGPMRMGTMTGRGMGFCAGYDRPGYTGSIGGGIGFGRGCRLGYGGRGWRRGFDTSGLPGWKRFGPYNMPYSYTAPYPQTDPEMQKQALKSQSDLLQAELDQIRKRLEEIDATKGS
ncbi:MAG TPA: DUF5320 domain-containing protein [Syntrophales bacterium]|nr:DUF5320 domain-containing protein [Syntrophales bacterium]HPX56738.1 DUF5320 domain-containing protein [Syntrophales bacterium]